VGLSRVDSRGQGTDRLESESRAFHERVRYAFLDLAAADPKRYLVLDAARPATEIAEAVTGRLTGLLATASTPHPAPAPASGPPVSDTAPPVFTPDAPPPVSGLSDVAPVSGLSDVSPVSDSDGVPSASASGDVPSVAARDTDSPARGVTAAGQARPVEHHTPPPLEEIAEVLGIDDEAPADPPRPTRP
jgi:dTMP kinase